MLYVDGLSAILELQSRLGSLRNVSVGDAATMGNRSPQVSGLLPAAWPLRWPYFLPLLAKEGNVHQ